MSSDFPDDKIFIPSLRRFLKAKGENRLASALEGATCSWRSDYQYADEWNIYWVDLTLRVSDKGLEQITDTDREKLVAYGDKILGREHGFKLSSVDALPALQEDNDIIPTDNKRIFICYSRQDKIITNTIVNLLRLGGFIPWFDEDLPPGSDWKFLLSEQIQKSAYFMYIVSNDSLSSEWCQWEFGEAAKHGKVIIPTLVRKTLNIPESLSKYQYADFSEGISAEATARLFRGLIEANFYVAPEAIPNTPENPRGKPVQAVEV